MSDKKIVTLEIEEGKKVDYEVVEIIEIEDNKYAFLAEVGDEEDAYVFKLIEKDGQEEYEIIDDDDEFERVVEEYESYFDEE